MPSKPKEDVDDFFSNTFEEREREKILLYGDTNTGKTFSILQLAKYMKERSPDSTLFIIDSDAGVNKLWKHEFPEVKNLKYKLVRSWPEVKEAKQKIKAVAKADDWVVIDMIGHLWEMAQNYEMQEVYGESAIDFLITARAAAVEAARRNQPASLPQVDWGVIKKLHNEEFIQEISTQWNCHVLATTSADKLGDSSRESSEAISLFSTIGYKPDGEKRNPFRFDTIMFICLRKDGTRYFTTIKDRSRPLFENEAFGECLWVDYDLALDSMGFKFLPGV